MIEIKDLDKNYGELQALKAVTLTVEPGEIWGLMGPNGAGKSTLLKIICGMVAASSGNARICGHDVREETVKAQQCIGFVHEQGTLFEQLTAFEYLELVARLRKLDPQLSRQRIEDLLARFNLQEFQHSLLINFSKGMKQKVLISSALLHNPQVLLLDEPLSGLDYEMVQVVKRLLAVLAREGRTIFFSSHTIEVVENICSRISILDQGRLVASGTREELLMQADTDSLEEAFGVLTGIRDTDSVVRDLSVALRTGPEELRKGQDQRPT